MKRAPWPLGGFLSLLMFAVATATAQEGEEVITLSPYATTPAFDERGGAIETGGAMPSYSSSGGTMFRSRTSRGTGAITLRKRAENVALAITLVNEGRNAETRNREMLDTLSRLLDRAGETRGIRVHNGALTLSTRDRKLSLLSSFAREPATRVDLYVLGELAEGQSALEVTHRIKSFLSAVEKVGVTKIVEGSVGLSIREPERFRRELLAAIIADVHFVKTTLGDEVKINLTGLDQRISVRQFSDVEVELAIPYGYAVEYSAVGAGR